MGEGRKFNQEMENFQKALTDKQAKELERIMELLNYGVGLSDLKLQVNNAEKVVEILKEATAQYTRELEKVQEVKEIFLKKVKKIFANKREEWGLETEFSYELINETVRTISISIEMANKRLMEKEAKLKGAISEQEYQELKKELETMIKKSYLLGGAEEDLRCQERAGGLLNELERL